MLLPVKTLCHCGSPAKVGKNRVGLFFVVCTTCSFSPGTCWQTMTVAIFDWESAIQNHKHRPKEEDP